MAIINAFPDGVARPDVRELCRFTSSGTFDPAQYPTADGLYDVYIVGGGGGGYYYWSNTYPHETGGGGGYAKLLKGLALSGNVAVTIGGAGVNGRNNTLTGSGSNGVTATDGGATRFGNYGTANGGKATNSYGTGGDGGCGGAGAGGSLGGVDGNDGTSGVVLDRGVGYSGAMVGVPGKGGGTRDYCPTNPYDNMQYGIGGNSTYGIYGYNRCARLRFPPLNNNAGRGGMGAVEESAIAALPGVCIIYGRPLE